MAECRKELSEAEIWDDSALLQSWDDALTEYKLYHGIHARGERVGDVVKKDAVEAEDMNVTEYNLLQIAADVQTNGILSEKPEDGKPEEEPGTAQAYLKEDPRENVNGTSNTESKHTQCLSTPTGVDQKATPEMPLAVISGVKDKNLKNLMMSWYYAGYYTGWYEGQQQMQRNISN